MREGAEAFARGDRDWYRDRLDPRVLIRFDDGWPEQDVHGRDAVIRCFSDGRDALGPAAEIEEVRDLGDRVLIRWWWRTRGERSGIENNLRWSQLDTIRDGRIILSEHFLDHGDALKAVGLDG